ncbi:MAG TPA: glycosyltransferase family 2 protein [Candidatus Sumerlaeota bacterium]|nr:MAG: Undecaprenyl-phosphate 4-deoxy-4-formamido-L-arabinose transferase [candidate division BRC1 bacterium ADurb.Bin183]HOE63212.1 glycosyltransferase family 2 protein [Candidatus Sumerlaeota bacterium]HRR30894.1 glycosyltransferase family 2 protein [Candidatus Sumerlaeia bacterium]HON50570.1 glycosyltransferase family 2 protein [Candidatus Sumerlaeota bacterium]HOR65392.1 glycosyltransferase family 2 protein [Candidatus Sumerlaeota bacterium]
MLLSVIMPVYNEKKTIRAIVDRVMAVPIEKELIIVDDGSKDGTREILKEFAGRPDIKIILHKKNQGKGAAIATGLKNFSGDYVVIQDADLEYHPEEYSRLLEPLLRGDADVVYGSRFKGAGRAFLFWHKMGNIFLNFVTNILYNSTLTDMETCYKMFRRDVVKGMKIESRKFNVEPEVTAKILKRGYRVYEVPITYSGRDFSEGKKITWRDGFSALWTLIKFRFKN